MLKFIIYFFWGGWGPGIELATSHSQLPGRLYAAELYPWPLTLKCIHIALH